MAARQEGIPQSLLVHDGELDDLRAVLEGLGTPFVERRGALSEADRAVEWSLVVATPRHMLGLQLTTPFQPMRIVIYDQHSRTLRNSLSRAGIELMVRRPVHPAALRGLILHSLYRGPEKRRDRRVTVGAPIRFRSGWRQHPGILADLSLGGCRILASQPVPSGGRLTLSLPAEVAGGSAYTLRASSLRSVPVEGAAPGTCAIHASFDSLQKRKHKRLESTIRSYRAGPATFDVADTDAAPPSPAPQAPQAPVDRPLPRQRPVAVAAATERRQAERKEIEQRVVALDEEADRVLMGRDISLGGMRVNTSPHLAVGKEVKLAMHVHEGAPPLTVRARVHRDDGERGVVLRFHELSSQVSDGLMQMLESLPVLAPGNDAEDTGYVVSEILEVGTV